MWQSGIPFRKHRDSGRREPVSHIKDIYTSTEIIRAIIFVQASFYGNLQTCRTPQRISFKCHILKPRYLK